MIPQIDTQGLSAESLEIEKLVKDIDIAVESIDTLQGHLSHGFKHEEIIMISVERIAEINDIEIKRDQTAVEAISTLLIVLITAVFTGLYILVKKISKMFSDTASSLNRKLKGISFTKDGDLYKEGYTFTDLRMLTKTKIKAVINLPGHKDGTRLENLTAIGNLHRSLEDIIDVQDFVGDIQTRLIADVENKISIIKQEIPKYKNIDTPEEMRHNMSYTVELLDKLAYSRPVEDLNDYFSKYKIGLDRSRVIPSASVTLDIDKSKYNVLGIVDQVKEYSVNILPDKPVRLYAWQVAEPEYLDIKDSLLKAQDVTERSSKKLDASGKSIKNMQKRLKKDTASLSREDATLGETMLAGLINDVSKHYVKNATMTLNFNSRLNAASRTLTTVAISNMEAVKNSLDLMISEDKS